MFRSMTDLYDGCSKNPPFVRQPRSEDSGSGCSLFDVVGEDPAHGKKRVEKGQGTQHGSLKCIATEP